MGELCSFMGEAESVKKEIDKPNPNSVPLQYAQV